jgi:hypothetical protein
MLLQLPMPSWQLRQLLLLLQLLKLLEHLLLLVWPCGCAPLLLLLLLL